MKCAHLRCFSWHNMLGTYTSCCCDSWHIHVVSLWFLTHTRRVAVILETFLQRELLVSKHEFLQYIREMNEFHRISFWLALLQKKMSTLEECHPPRRRDGQTGQCPTCLHLPRKYIKVSEVQAASSVHIRSARKRTVSTVRCFIFMSLMCVQVTYEFQSRQQVSNMSFSSCSCFFLGLVASFGSDREGKWAVMIQVVPRH